MTDEVKKDPVKTDDSKESISNGTGDTADAVEEKKEETTPAEEPKVEEKKEEAPKVEEKKEEAVDEGADVEVPKKFKSIVEEIENMSVLDLNELVKLFEKKFGVSAAAVAVAGGGADAEGDEGAKDSFTVELSSIGDSKVAVIKAVKEILGLGLKDAKDLVEGAPVEIKKDIKKEEAEEIKGKLEEAGGQVTLK